MLTERTVDAFTADLASASPTPGGGSAAALAGALAAALVQMVADLTLDREAYKAHEREVRAVRDRAAAARRDLLALVDRDARAYDAVVQALRLPKATEAEKAGRAEALARALQYATETPLATAEASAAIMEMAIALAFKGNLNALSDAGTAAMLAYAAVRGAVMNVRANLKGLKDETRAAALRDRVRRLEMDAEKRREEALVAVQSRGGAR
jgi:formiminotetrahydrofolate cyclodeaminase